MANTKGNLKTARTKYSLCNDRKIVVGLSALEARVEEMERKQDRMLSILESLKGNENKTLGGETSNANDTDFEVTSSDTETNSSSSSSEEECRNRKKHKSKRKHTGNGKFHVIST